MRLCQCGGRVLQGHLTRGRESWCCKVCGRFQIFGETDEAKSLHGGRGKSDQADPCIQPQTSDSACFNRPDDNQDRNTGGFNQPT